MKEIKTKVVNGVDVTELFKTIDAVKATPGIAKFKFRLKNEWNDGGHNKSTITSFHGVGQDMAHDKAFELDADEPPALLGKDLAPNPVEYLLTALASCVTTSIVYHAAARGIRIDDIECSVEGELDLQGFLGLNPGIRRGYEKIRMDYRIKSQVSDEQLQELVNLGPTFSPVFDSITKGVPITVSGSRM